MSSLRTILIVDDNETNRKILSKILQNDYNIIEAENGEVALSVLRKNYEIISVVLLDILMPVLDGYGVLREMRKESNLNTIPVIVASGQGGDDSEIKALSLGANDYVLKPYNPATIRHRIANTIYLRETASFVNSVQHDSLTGLLGKDYFYICAEEMLKSNPEKNYDIICCDIERFKLVNDLYGFKTGDELLKEVADMLKNFIGENGICGRIGADIFAVMIEHNDNYDNDYFARTIEYINKFKINLKITIKYGVYVIDDRTQPISIMCDRACLAMDSIKGKYDKYFSYYNDEIRQQLLNEQYITLNMNNALLSNQFVVYFQPKYDLKTQKIVGAEALVRCNSPEKGFMSPGEFIPLFERNGFITDLDIFVWETACQKIRNWIDNGNTPIPVSVNVSRADIYNPHIDTILLSLIKKYRISPKYLYLEITETAYTENPDQLIKTVQNLKKLGFVIEMDDFGTGYSSLNMLSELPIDVLKLDIKFIQNEEKKNNSRSILSFIISLAKWLDLKVIAEGVETAEQVSLLRSFNCEYAQGFYYARPLPEDKFDELFLKDFANDDSHEIIVKEKSEENFENMIIFDSKSIDFPLLQSAFQNKFSISHTLTQSETLKLLEELKSKVSVFIFSLYDELSVEILESLDNICKLYNIPFIGIHQSEDTVAKTIEIGAADYILRPYKADDLRNRIENSIYRSQIMQLKKDQGINTAICEMKKRAEEDYLTGLLNRAEFEERIQDFFYDNVNPQSVFIILDIDSFKNVNDAFGHTAGDDVLKKVAKILNKSFPETSTMSRMGGDEFAIFIPYELNKDELNNKLKNLCNSTSFSIEHMDISISVGACIAPEFGSTYREVYSNADIALLTAKRFGKKQYRIFEQGMEAPLMAQLEAKAAVLLDDVSDAMFVSDAVTSEIVYINDTACQLINKKKNDCLGERCYQIFWDSCKNCDRCFNINSCTKNFY